MHHGLSGYRLFVDLAILEVAMQQRLVVRLRTERTWHTAKQNGFLDWDWHYYQEMLSQEILTEVVIISAVNML